MINQINKELERVDGDICTEFEFQTLPKEILRRGTYGKVYKMKNKFDNQYYAVICIKKYNEKEGFPITSLREIKFLTTKIKKMLQKQNRFMQELRKIGIKQRQQKHVLLWILQQMIFGNYQQKLLSKNEQQKFYFTISIHKRLFIEICQYFSK